MKVYIVRHGQTYFNVMGRVQGWCDSPLTKQGIQQAEHLASYFESIPLASGYHSGSERAADTLDLILKDREVTKKRDKRFKEVFFGDYEGGSQINPTGKEEGAFFAVRGGSWYDREEKCRIHYRQGLVPNTRRFDIGFRLAL